MKFTTPNGHEVTIDDSPEVQAEVFKRVVAFFVQNETFSGESIMQSDVSHIEGPPFLAELVDVLKPEVVWNEDEL